MTDPRTVPCAEVDDLGALYVLDALGPDEAAVVPAHLADHPERHRTITELAGVTPFLAESVAPAAPPSDLRDRVLRAIADTPQAAAPAPSGAIAPSGVIAPSGATAPSGAAVDAARPPDARPVELPAPYPLQTDVPAPAWGAPVSLDTARARRERRSPLWGVLAAAAVVAIVVLGGWNVLLQQQGAETQRRLELLTGAIAASGQPGARVATLTGSQDAAGATGYAVFPEDGEGYLVLTALPPAPPDRTWQAWTLAGDAATSAGLVPVGGDGLAVLEGIQAPVGTQVVALTLEPAGGSTGPTSAPVVVGQLASPLAQHPGSWIALVP